MKASPLHAPSTQHAHWACADRDRVKAALGGSERSGGLSCAARTRALSRVIRLGRRCYHRPLVKAHDYRDTVATYLDRVFGSRGLVIYTEVSLGKTIIGKNRRIDVFVLREADQRALAIECKFQNVSGTADEKIPYALQDLEALWIPGCLVYGGCGWSDGVLHTLRGSKRAVYCLPEPPLMERTEHTRELDHVVAAVFGLWDIVLPAERIHSNPRQLSLPLKGLRKASPPTETPVKKVAREDG